jgi:hypothetical protein
MALSSFHPAGFLQMALSIGNGEVLSSILSGSTINWGFFEPPAYTDFQHRQRKTERFFVHRYGPSAPARRALLSRPPASQKRP